MKTFAMAVALLSSTAAIAQTTTPMDPGTSTGSTSTDTTMPPTGTTNDGMQPAPADTTAGQRSATPPAGQTDMMTPQPSPSTPPMDPAAPRPMNNRGAMGATDMSGTAPAPTASTADYPRCSATVIDQCRQGSARESDRRGGPRARRR